MRTTEAPLCGMVKVTSEHEAECGQCDVRPGEDARPPGWKLGADGKWSKCAACDGKANVVVEQYEGWQLCAGEVIWSVEATAEAAVLALCKERGWSDPYVSGKLDSDSDSGFDWGLRFVADGTSFKAAGVNVPGGTVLTWWK